MDRPHSEPSGRTAAAGSGALIRRILPAALLLTILLTLVAACRFPGSVRPTVKIGLVAPFEGRYRYVGYDVIYAVRLALREANEGGGLNGHGVELAAFDDRGDPAAAGEQVPKLAVDPQVLAALGHFRRETTLAAAPGYADAGLPLLAAAGMDAGLEPLRDYDAYVFGLAVDVERVATALAGKAAALAPDRQVVLATEARGGPRAEALAAAASENGLTLRVVEAARRGWQQDVLGYYPEVLLCDLDPVAAGNVVAFLGEGGWRGEVLGGPALAAADFAAIAGAASEGAVFLTPWPFPRDVAGTEEFVELYREVSNGTEPGPLALPAYEAARLLLDAVEDAVEEGDVTRDGVAHALKELEGEDWLATFRVGGRGVPARMPLYWYRIGEDGAPLLVGEEPVSGTAPGALE